MKKVQSSVLLLSALCTISSSTDMGLHPFAQPEMSSGSNANHLSSLLRKSTAIRSLEDAYNGQIPDLSQYSIKFEKCQSTKQYSNNNNGWVDTVLSMKRFVVFRLCPAHSCSSCSSNFGEYIIDMESYLETMIEQKNQEQEQYCNDCDACLAIEQAADDQANDDDGMCNNVDTSTCYSKCQNIAKMENNGYVDAAQYTQCGKVYQNQNTGVSYYAGAMCSSSGTHIKIGLFKDEQCSELDSSAEIDHYIKNEKGYNVKLSYHLLKQVTGGDDCLASCAGDDYNDDGSSNGVSQVCQALYEDAGKCESNHGFSSGIDSNQDNYSSQILNEKAVCEFISTIQAGHYDQSGEIVLTGITSSSMAASIVHASDGQTFALTFFVVGTVGLAAYAFYLKRKIGQVENLMQRDLVDV